MGRNLPGSHDRWHTGPDVPDASGWLLSTIDDYWAFVQMLLDNGVSEGERIISEASVDLTSPEPPEVFRDFRTGTYGAVADRT